MDLWLCAHACTPSCTVRLSHGCVLDAWGLLASLGCSRSTHIYTQSASKLCCTDCRAPLVLCLCAARRSSCSTERSCTSPVPCRRCALPACWCAYCALRSAALHSDARHQSLCTADTESSPSLPPWPSPLCWACLRGPRHQRDLSESAYAAGPEPPAAVHTLGRAVGRRGLSGLRRAAWRGVCSPINMAAQCSANIC